MLFLCNKLLLQFDLLAALTEQDTLLFVEEGTYNLAKPDFMAFCQDKQLKCIYAIAVDVQSRAISLPSIIPIELISYAQYVNLCATHSRIYQL